MTANGNWLCDGGSYAQRIFKTAIAKPVLSIVIFSKAMAKHSLKNCIKIPKI